MLKLSTLTLPGVALALSLKRAKSRQADSSFRRPYKVIQDYIRVRRPTPMPLVLEYISLMVMNFSLINYHAEPSLSAHFVLIYSHRTCSRWNYRCMSEIHEEWWLKHRIILLRFGHESKFMMRRMKLLISLFHKLLLIWVFHFDNWVILFGIVSCQWTVKHYTVSLRINVDIIYLKLTSV